MLANSKILSKQIHKHKTFNSLIIKAITVTHRKFKDNAGKSAITAIDSKEQTVFWVHLKLEEQNIFSNRLVKVGALPTVDDRTQWNHQAVAGFGGKKDCDKTAVVLHGEGRDTCKYQILSVSIFRG